MPETYSWKKLDRFYMNNCKIANELRKYRDLAGKVNWVALSGEGGSDPRQAADRAQYVISRDLTYMDMMVANAAYSLWRYSAGQGTFTAETICQVMAGRMDCRAGPVRQAGLERRLQQLADTWICILADQDHQVTEDLYEGAFLPVTWETRGKRLRFHFSTGMEMPLYRYGEAHRQLLELPLSRLRDQEGLGNNTDQNLLLRHYMLQELEILLYQGNKVTDQKIRLLRRDWEGQEFGLLWTLGLVDETGAKDPRTAAQAAQSVLCQLLKSWQREGILREEQYRFLTPEEGWGVLLSIAGTGSM